MKSANLKEIKQELNHRSTSDLLELNLKLARFKKENKELLTYLLFEASNEERFRSSIKELMDEQFENINTTSYYFIRKSVRKILTSTKKYIRYSKKKETEIELLLYFCFKLKSMTPSFKRSPRLVNVFQRQLLLIKKINTTLHEDLQYDYNLELEKLLSS